MAADKKSSRKKNSRRDSFHQRQIRFFSILFGLVVVVFIVGILWFISRSPGAAPLFGH
jgi:dolichyl-phosphate-mannose--protein O-mannosyl transferase